MSDNADRPMVSQTRWDIPRNLLTSTDTPDCPMGTANTVPSETKPQVRAGVPLSPPKGGLPNGTAAPQGVGHACRSCGCTDDDCSICIVKTGHPCHWIEDDLCSACADPREAYYRGDLVAEGIRRIGAQLDAANTGAQREHSSGSPRVMAEAAWTGPGDAEAAAAALETLGAAIHPCNPANRPALPEGTADGAALIAAERRRQVEDEGWTPDHDAKHRDQSLARAAACYALPGSPRLPQEWPWAPESWKPTPDDRVRELVKAGALIAAEIDRLAAPVVAVPEAGEGRSVLDPPTSEHSAAMVASMPGMGRGAEVCDNTYPPPGRDGTCLSCGKRRAPVVGEREEKP